MLKHKVEHVKLASGLEGLIIDTPKTGVVVAEISFRAGEFLLNEEKWETAHLMEHVLLGANKYYKKARDFQAVLEQNGAAHNASTSVYDITYEVESADFEWQRVLGLLFDAISTPLFLQEEFDSELSSIKEELAYRSNNHFRHLNLGLRKQMDLCGMLDLERLELVDGVTRADLVEHYEKTHTLPNARFIIAGHFGGNYEEVISLLNDRLNLPKRGKRISMPKEKPSLPAEPFTVRKPSVPNIYLYMDMYAGEQLDEKDMAALQIITTMLIETWDSKIFGTARERGLVYSMFSGAEHIGFDSGWWIAAQVSKTNSEPLLRLIRDECKKLRDGEIEQVDFDAAQKYLLGKTMRAGQTASGLVTNYNKFYYHDVMDDLNKVPALLKSVTPSRCVKVFQKICDNNKWGIGVLGSTSLVPARKLHSYIEEIFQDS